MNNVVGLNLRASKISLKFSQLRVALKTHILPVTVAGRWGEKGSHFLQTCSPKSEGWRKTTDTVFQGLLPKRYYEK